MAGPLGKVLLPVANHSTGEIINDVWRIAPVPGRRPTVSLSSPLIGKDSALFDRLTLRLRLMHHSPTEHGELRLGWANNAEDRSQWTSRLQSYPIEWEEITIDLRALAAAPEQEVIWQDTLFNFSIYMILYRDSQDLENHPKTLEVDWIRLTGAEELAQGELSPTDIAVETGAIWHVVHRTRLFPAWEEHRHLRLSAKIARGGGRCGRRWRCGSRGGLEPPHRPRTTPRLDRGVQRRARQL